jgi:hypothetical protein
MREGALSTRHLEKVQRRREFPMRVTQMVQALIRQQVGGRPDVSGTRRLPWIVQVLERTTLLRRMRTRFIGIGVRPEHVKTPDVSEVHTRPR